MTKREREHQIANAKKALKWWTERRAEAIKAGDRDALTEAEAGRNNAFIVLSELQPKK